MGCSNPSRLRASALTHTNSLKRPPKPSPTPALPLNALAAARRLDPPPLARCPLLRLSLLLFRSFFCHHHFSRSSVPPPLSFTPGPRLFTNCFLCRALTPPDYLYGGWAGSGPGTGRKPRIYRGSGVDAGSTAQSALESGPTQLRCMSLNVERR